MKDKALNLLFEKQMQSFTLAKEKYDNLKNVICKDIPNGVYTLRVQHNPARMISTNARIDKATLQNRDCFLCEAHRPKEQKGIPYGENYHIFINPYPIFTQHFTVPSNRHEPQLIAGRLGDMLDLAFDYPGYTVFYNGPACGASAPDHFHFQMAPRHLMPLEEDVYCSQNRKMIHQGDFYTISTLNDYLRKVVLLETSDQNILKQQFQFIQQTIGEAVPYDLEPMLNLLCWFENCQWTICIFPRKLLRPWQFFAEGDEKILFSPGCVDMAGLIIAPRLEDFQKYSLTLLTDLYQQVTVDATSWDQITHKLQHAR